MVGGCGLGVDGPETEQAESFKYTDDTTVLEIKSYGRFNISLTKKIPLLSSSLNFCWHFTPSGG